MALIDLVDETFVVAAPADVAAVVHDPARWARWWPDLALTVFMDRGDAGIRWSVAGPWLGSCEVWLEPYGDGVVLHHYLRVDPAPATTRAPNRPHQVARLRARRAQDWKRHAWALKDELERGRPAGEDRVPPAVKDGLEGVEAG